MSDIKRFCPEVCNVLLFDVSCRLTYVMNSFVDIDNEIQTYNELIMVLPIDVSVKIGDVITYENNDFEVIKINFGGDSQYGIKRVGVEIL